ncbi:PIN domain-containing protein [Candidatus Saccharibacteria bacterium]|nr:PIN domain-containing protein [Candidatus Saccharibacteria bacterium]
MASKNHIETLDTNIVLRIVLNDVPKLTDEVIHLLIDDSRTFLIPDVVFCEMIHILTKKIGYTRVNAVREITKALSAFYNLSYDLHIVTEVFNDYVTHPALSFEDCYLAYYATKNGAKPLWTFDQKLAKESPVAKAL